MSFGWSAGDIISAIALVNRIIKCVGNAGGAQEQFQELESELDGLLRALKDIKEVTSLPDQVPEIVALKFAACLCEETLKRFYEKIKPFDESLGVSSRKSKVKAAPRMVRWELLVKKDIPELRTYLVAHVGSLSLRLNTALLKLGARAFSSTREHHIEQLKASNAIEQQISIQSQTIVEKITALAQQDNAPKLESFLSLATNVWKAQNEMMEMFAKAIQTFEDALGRIMPVPSEYDWDKFEAIIQVQFKNGPGKAKVQSGEYELLMGTNSITPMRKIRDFYPLPGTTITMTIILGQYIGTERCPRLGCSSRLFRRGRDDKMGLVCTECNSWFRKSGATLPKPLKPRALSTPLRSDLSLERGLDTKFRNLDLEYEDRKTYKNISIYITELPPPTPTRFRDKYTRNYEPRQEAKSKLPPDSSSGYRLRGETPPFAVWKKQNDAHPGHRRQTYQMAFQPKTAIPRHRQTSQMAFQPKTVIPRHRRTYAFDRHEHVGHSIRLQPARLPLVCQDIFQTNSVLPDLDPVQQSSRQLTYIALQDYQGRRHSELSFKKGDIIQKLHPIRAGWQVGLLNGSFGNFSLDHVMKIVPESLPPTDADPTCLGTDDHEGYSGVYYRNRLDL
ncbi:hypothetical protein V8E51_015426 [Hyaloscypha variabilis]